MFYFIPFFRTNKIKNNGANMVENKTFDTFVEEQEQRL